jgi:hypothetical protein
VFKTICLTKKATAGDGQESPVHSPGIEACSSLSSQEATAAAVSAAMDAPTGTIQKSTQKDGFFIPIIYFWREQNLYTLGVTVNI